MPPRNINIPVRQLFHQARTGANRRPWSVAVGIRRLHDIERAGWWQLLWLVPLIGWIVLIVWACTKGTAGENRFGADPLAPAATPAGAQPA
jgi:hypothetical protein